MVDSDASSGSSSSSSSDSVLIRVPLDQNRRKKLRAQLQEDQRRQLERQLSAVDATSFKTLKSDPESDRSKGEHICVVCEREGDDLVICTGPCISAFHVSCLPPDYNVRGIAHGVWLCPSCKSKTHACFHCKQTGVETLKDEAPASSSSDIVKKPVRKCRALSCGKFYHQHCITQFPLARIAINTHFICPLHTCAGCNQSGAQQEAVRCMRCPVAYHAKCLPDDCVRQISPKLIICPKHGNTRLRKEDRQERKSETLTQMSMLQAQDENEDEAVSEASAVSLISGKKKKEKKEKRDKKKKKKKKKKDKHKRESLASQADNEHDEKHGKKRKRSKKDLLEADDSSPLIPSTRHLESVIVVTDPETTHAPAVIESPATATKRIQERLEEALGKSDDEESDVSTDSRLEGMRRLDRLESEIASDTKIFVRETSSNEEIARQTRPLSIDEVKDSINSPIPPSSAPASPSGDHIFLEVQSSAEEDTADSKSVQKMEHKADDASINRDEKMPISEDTSSLVTPKSPSINASDLPTSNSLAGTLRLKHVSNEKEIDDEEGTGSITPSADTTPRTPRYCRGYGKKRRKNKAKREAQRGTKRGVSEEDDEEVNEAKWVQCDSCKKWRTVPKDINLDAMPKHWYCNMNTWDERFASCDIAEEVLKANPSPSRGKRRNKLKMKSKSTASSTGDDGGYSSCESGPLRRPGGLLKDLAAGVTMSEERDINARSKFKEKGKKKRKMTKQLKEKYREVKWVQCESTQCGKWRVVPASINFDRLPAVWYCHLNTWTPELAKCSAPNPPEVDTFWLKQTKKKDRPTKNTRTSSTSADLTPTVSVSTIASTGMTPVSSATGLASLGKWNMTKHGKNSKSTMVAAGNEIPINSGVETINSHPMSGDSSTAFHAMKGKGGRALNTTSGVKKTVLEWAQCEKCNKWRKLPQHIKSSTLPDKWYCSMNHWDPSHAKCSIPEEVDQEPLPLPPHPGSQWHKGGHKGQRTRRGRLSYSELLYGSTGQLRKAYTRESSTLSFEYEGRMYYRDDQYKNSSMYVSPAAVAAAATMAGWSGSDRIIQETSCTKDGKVNALAAATHPQATVDQIAALVLESMDLRCHRSVSELYTALNSSQRRLETAATGLTSLAMVTAALGQLEHRGLVEKVDELTDEDDDPESQKRRRLDALHYSAFSIPIRYRKVPTRPLKASKCWRFGGNLLARSQAEDT
ncbi:putative Zinc finger, PHD-type, Zinc finger, FYVE/PHD-type, Zinc finger, CW-type [Plasmopara halstedii]